MKKQNLIGIDVSEASIKVLQLDSDNTIVAYGSTRLPVGVVEKGSIIDTEVFGRLLKDLLIKTSPEKSSTDTEDSVFHAVLSLPETKIFSHHCLIPEKIKESELKTFVSEEATKIIPFPLDNLYWSYYIAEKNRIKSATFIGVVKSDLDKYVQAFTSAKVYPTYLGGELFALGSALLPEQTLEEIYLILDMGEYSSTVGIYSVGAVPDESIVIWQGGEYFTRYLAEWLGITMEEAEQMKKQYGVDSSHEDTRVPGLLRDCLNPLVDKVIEAKNYFEKKTGKQIKHIIIAGGSALMPQISSFIAEKIGVETSIADPLQKVAGHERLNKDTPGIFLANVIGLALCGSSSDLEQVNLLAQYQDDEKVSEAKELLANKKINSLIGLYYVTREFFRVLIAKNKVNYKLFLTIILTLAAVIFLIWTVISYT